MVIIICNAIPIIFLIYIWTYGSLIYSYQIKQKNVAAYHLHRLKQEDQSNRDFHIKLSAPALVVMNTDDIIINSMDEFISAYRPHIINTNLSKTEYPHNKIITSTRSFRLFLPICSTFLIPSIAIASAQDSLQLLHGYHSRTPDIVSGIVLISILFFIQNRLERFLSSF